LVTILVTKPVTVTSTFSSYKVHYRHHGLVHTVPVALSVGCGVCACAGPALSCRGSRVGASSGAGRADSVVLGFCHGDVASAFAGRVVLLVHVFGSVGMLLLIGVPRTCVCGGNDLREQCHGGIAVFGYRGFE
jgi:hypothetical protein